MDFGLTNAPRPAGDSPKWRPPLFGLREPARPSALTMAERRNFLLRFGTQTNAYFHLQDDVQHFDMPDVGFLSYFSQRTWTGRHQDLVFAKPICAPSNLAVLVDAYLRERGGNPIFAGMDAVTARLLEQRGYAVNQIGTEFNIDLLTFKVRGRQMKYLRNVQHLGDKGVSVHELPWSAVKEDEVWRISNQWLSTKQVRGRELRLLTRPPEWEDRWGVRKFYAFQDGRMIGFVFFDPFFRDNKVVGYCANILRAEPGLAAKGVLDYTILTAMEKFKQEGMETLALGMAPCHDVQSQLRERPGLRLILQQLYRHGGSLYSFQQLAFHKTRYRGSTRRLYACVRGISDLRAAIFALRCTNVF